MKILILLFTVFSTSVNAECFIITDLSTSWQRTLSKIFIHMGERREIRYLVEIEQDSVKILPSELNCILHFHKKAEGITAFSCGVDLGVLTTSEESAGEQDENENPIEKYGIKYSKYTGTLRESWTILWEPGAVLLSESGNKAKTYSGIIYSSC